MNRITKTIKYEKGINLLWGITEEGRLVLLYCGAGALTDEKIKSLAEDEFAYECSPVEIKAGGLNCPPNERFAGQLVHSSLSELLIYRSHKISEDETTATVVFELGTADGTAAAELNYLVYPAARAVRCSTTVRNLGEKELGLEEVTSFSYCGLGHDNLRPYSEQLAINILHNGWQKELQWQRYTPEQLGLALSQPGRRTDSSKTISFGNIGNWSTKNFIPCVYLEKLIDGEYLGIQIENNGSWSWQIGEHMRHLYFKAAGPTESYGSWYRRLKRERHLPLFPWAWLFRTGPCRMLQPT